MPASGFSRSQGQGRSAAVCAGPSAVMAGGAARERAEAKRNYCHDGCRSADWDFLFASPRRQAPEEALRRLVLTVWLGGKSLIGVPTKQVAADIYTESPSVV